MRCAPIAVGMLCVASIATTAYAHDYRPLLVRVSEESSGRYVLSWQPSPVLSASDQPLVELTGAGCRSESKEKSMSNVNKVVYRCDNLLTRLRVEITYPNDNPSLPTLLNLTREDGSVTRLTASPSSRSIILSEPQTESLQARSYAFIGFDHILRGVDHLVFLSFLWLITDTGWVLIRALTGFTLGHSVTLALATSGVTTPSAPFIESMIALSIVLMAAESLRSERLTLTLRHPVMVSTLFGLLHGFGFAGYLGEVGLPKNQEILALLMFNIGVELGQIAFVIIVVMASVIIHKVIAMLPATSNPLAAASFKKRLKKTAAYAGGIVATYWFMERSWEALSAITAVGFTSPLF